MNLKRGAMSLAAIIIAGLIGGIAVAGEPEAWAALKSKNYVEAAREYRALANEGDLRAMYMLGTLYRTGKGVPLDLKGIRI